MTKVKFLLEKDSEDVFAYFPEMTYTVDEGKDGLFTCYAPIGQHSACHEDYVKECKDASYNEYAALLRELIGQGYKDMVVLNYQPITVHRQPTKGEIKFGEGATHYKQWNLSTLIKKNGDLKQWFMAKDDGLRYYRM